MIHPMRTTKRGQGSQAIPERHIMRCSVCNAEIGGERGYWMYRHKLTGERDIFCDADSVGDDPAWVFVGGFIAG